MAVYVDMPMDFSTDKSPLCFRGVKSCHMYADTLEELHAMADMIGLKRAWFQDSRDLRHYDLTPGKRTIAVRCGAIAQDRQEAARKWRELRLK